MNMWETESVEEISIDNPNSKFQNVQGKQKNSTDNSKDKSNKPGQEEDIMNIFVKKKQQDVIAGKNTKYEMNSNKNITRRIQKDTEDK